MKHVRFTQFRRLTALLLAVLLLASLAGCKKKDSGDDTAGSSSVPTESAEATTEPTTQPTVPTTEAPSVTPIDPTEEPEEDVITGIITASELNIREEAGSNFESVGAYYRGDQVVILEIKGAWGRTDKGWISMNYVKLDTPAETEPEDETEPEEEQPNEDLVTDKNNSVLGYGVVTLDSLNVRTGPGTKYEDIGDVTLASRYPYYQKDGNWVRIKSGWISLGYFYVEGTTGEGAGTGTIVDSDLNVRVGPGVDYERVDGIGKGETVKIQAQVNGWGFIGKGWISMHYVDMDGSGSSDKGTVTADVLNIRKEPSADSEKVGAYEEGDQIEILEIKGDWGRTDKGWVNLDYVRMDSAKKTGIVTADSLNIRKEASKDSEDIGSYKKGDKVTILEVKGNWGRTDKGWISLTYVKMDNVTGTITATSLFIRKEPSKKAEDVGYYEKGDTVTILEIKDDWGRTNKVWISMDYVDLD